MDQRFESEVMEDLAEGSPPLSADESFEEETFEGEGYEEGFEEEGMEEEAMLEGMEGFEEGGEGFEEEAVAEGFEDGFETEGYEEGFEGDVMEEDYAEEEADLAAELEDVMADAMDAEDSDEFLGRLVGGIRRLAGLAGRGARAVRQAAGTAQRVVRHVGTAARGIQGVAGAIAGDGRQPRRGQRRRPLPVSRPGGRQGSLRQMLPRLQQHLDQGSDEMDVFEDLADWFEEQEVDDALPIIAGVAARAALRPIMRHAGPAVGRNAARQIVRSATLAARTLARRQGPQAVRALPRIARSVGRAAARRGLRPAAIAPTLQRAAAQVAARPALVLRLIRAGSGSARRLVGSSGPRRLVVRGPAQIIIRR